MARRPKRTLSEELKSHEQCVVGLMTATGAMAGLYPDMSELRTAERLLDLAVAEFRRRLATATPPPPSPV